MMNIKLAASCIVAGALMLPLAGNAADSERSSPKTFVKDSVITMKIKADLAEEKISSLGHIKVDTDDKGQVTLGGSVPSKADADKAVSIARAVKGVTSVENHLKIVPEKK
jgi:hyperosmotically inducible protein